MEGHLQPARALAQALTARGHQCFLVCHPDIETSWPGDQRLVISPHSSLTTPQSFIEHCRHPALPFGVRRIVSDMVNMTNAFCQDAPRLLAENAIDAVVTDQMEPAGALVADHLKLPYVSFAAALPINREPLVPPSVLAWPYEDSPRAAKLNRNVEWISDRLTSAHDHAIADWSARWGLAPRRRLVDCISPLADISQMLPGLDFPRREMADNFHYFGPLRSVACDPVPALAIESDPRPLVYATLGTLQGHRLKLLQRIAKGCRLIGARLVVTYGNALTPQQAATIDADLVLPWAPQTELLNLASAVITHGGLNTVLDALVAGVPMLCLPLAFEQPGIAARVVQAGAGTMLPHRSSPARIAAALQHILATPSYRQNARAIGEQRGAAGGPALAATIVERALLTRQPVVRANLHSRDDKELLSLAG